MKTFLEYAISLDDQTTPVCVAIASYYAAYMSRVEDESAELVIQSDTHPPSVDA